MQHVPRHPVFLAEAQPKQVSAQPRMCVSDGFASLALVRERLVRALADLEEARACAAETRALVQR